MFDRTSNLDGNQIINYKVDANEKWCVLVGIAPGAPERYGSHPFTLILQILHHRPAALSWPRATCSCTLLSKSAARPWKHTPPPLHRSRYDAPRRCGVIIHLHCNHPSSLLSTQLGGSDAPSSVIAFAQKSLTNGQVVSKVHIIEVGPPPGARAADRMRNGNGSETKTIKNDMNVLHPPF